MSYPQYSPYRLILMAALSCAALSEVSAAPNKPNPSNKATAPASGAAGKTGALPSQPLPLAPAPAPKVPTNNVNILIVALDSVDGRLPTALENSAPSVVPPAAERQPQPPVPAPPGSIAPTVPGPVAPPLPGAITPAAFLTDWLKPIYRINAKRKPNNDAEIFQAVPDNAAAYPPRQRPGKSNSSAPQSGGGNGTFPTGASSLPTLPTGTNSGDADASPNMALERAPGIAQAAAAPLRRALTRLGFNDVLNTAPDSAAIQRAVNNWRLTTHVLDNLQASTARIVAVSLANPVGATASHVATAAEAKNTPDAASSGTTTATVTSGVAAPDAPQPNESQANALKEMLQPAIQSASRIGQALNYRAVIVLAVVPHTGTDAGSALLVPTAATGTGQGANAPTNKAGSAALPSPALPAKSATYALLIVDAARESGEPIVFDESGADDLSLNETAAGTGAALIEKRLNEWSPVAPSERAQKISLHTAAARAAAVKGDLPTAEDEIVQVIALDGTRPEAHVFLGDILQSSDPANAAAAYRRAVDLNANDGRTWAKIAITDTLGAQPNWPGTLEAGRNAIKLGYDTASVRTAMATAQYGRADIFRKYDRMDKAQDAEAEARQHLDRAIQLEPDNPNVARLMARQLVSQGRYSEALQSLDRLALQYPNDIGLQTQYAQVLTNYGRRDEDAFAAWAKVWKLTGAQGVTLDPLQYRHLSEGFDLRLDDIGRSAAQLTTSVAQGAMPRESALVQLARLKEDMTVAADAIKIIQAPADRNLSLMHTSRTFAADLMDQALDAHQTYLETGQDNFRVRAVELHRQSINRLNAARAARD